VSGTARLRLVAASLALLAALPVAVAPIPLMSDLPNHVARHHILAESLFGPGNPHWDVAWRWIGNLGVDLPAILLTPWAGAEQATRWIVMLIAPLTVLGLLALGRAAHGRITSGVALALPFVFAQPWHYGFVNSCLSVALALFVAAAWLRQPADSGWRALGFALAALAVWTAHVMGWGVLLLLVAGAELARRDWGALPRRAVRATPLLAPALPLLAWRGHGAGPMFVFPAEPVWGKAIDMATMLKGVSKPFDLAMLALILILALIALLLAGRPRLEPRLAVGVGLLALAFAIMPATLLGSWGADLRLAPVAAMVALAAIAPARSRRVDRILIGTGVSLFAVRAITIAMSWTNAQPALAERLAFVDQVPAGGRLAYLVAQPDCRTPWAFNLDNKLASFAVTRREAFANTLFHIPGADLIAARSPANALWYDGTQDVPCAEGAPGTRRRLAAMAAGGFDTIWLLDAPPAPIVPPGYRMTKRGPRDILLRRIDRYGLE
jgi:hypothetical protein